MSIGATIEAGGDRLPIVMLDATDMPFSLKIIFLKRWHRGKPERG